MARRLRVQLPELPEVLERHVVAAEVEQAVDQHRPVAGREHEPVAVEPLGIVGVVLQEPGPQHRRRVGHAHREARVARVRLLDGVDGEPPDGVGGHLLESGPVLGRAVGCGGGGVGHGARGRGEGGLRKGPGFDPSRAGASRSRGAPGGGAPSRSAAPHGRSGPRATALAPGRSFRTHGLSPPVPHRDSQRPPPSPMHPSSVPAAPGGARSDTRRLAPPGHHVLYPGPGARPRRADPDAALRRVLVPGHRELGAVRDPPPRPPPAGGQLRRRPGARDGVRAEPPVPRSSSARGSRSGCWGRRSSSSSRSPSS